MALTGQEGTELPATALSAGTPLNTAEALSIVRQSVGVLSPYRLICNRQRPCDPFERIVLLKLESLERE
jgi:hypothetical protein